MKKQKSINKINVKIMPSLRSLIKSDNNKNKSNIKNPYANKTSDKFYNTKRIKSSSIKVNKNINKYNPPPKRLNTINLIEKKINVLYDWKILLNNKNPGIYYNKDDYKKLAINTFKDDFNIPKNSVILLDLPDNQMKKYFGKNSLLQPDKHQKNKAKNNYSPIALKILESSKKNKTIFSSKEKPKIEIEPRNSIIDNYGSSINSSSNHVHPMSIYIPRDPYQSFYFSNDFNDYYKHDAKHYAEILPSLKAKIKTSNKKLMKEIINLKYKTIKDHINLKQFFEEDEKDFKVQDLIIAGIRNNPVRLMKNLYTQKHHSYKKVKQDMRMYFKTMKPLGEHFGEIDYTKNERWKTFYEVKRLRKKAKKEIRFHTLDNKENKSNLILSYYKATDPHIKYFNRIIRKYNKTIANTKDENNKLYTKGNSFNKRRKNKMTEIENNKNPEYLRDKIIKNANKNKLLNYKKYFFYFLTETTKNSNND